MHFNKTHLASYKFNYHAFPYRQKNKLTKIFVYFFATLGFVLPFTVVITKNYDAMLKHTSQTKGYSPKKTPSNSQTYVQSKRHNVQAAKTAPKPLKVPGVFLQQNEKSTEYSSHLKQNSDLISTKSPKASVKLHNFVVKDAKPKKSTFTAPTQKNSTDVTCTNSIADNVQSNNSAIACSQIRASLKPVGEWKPEPLPGSLKPNRASSLETESEESKYFPSSKKLISEPSNKLKQTLSKFEKHVDKSVPTSPVTKPVQLTSHSCDISSQLEQEKAEALPFSSEVKFSQSFYSRKTTGEDLRDLPANQFSNLKVEPVFRPKESLPSLNSNTKIFQKGSNSKEAKSTKLDAFTQDNDATQSQKSSPKDLFTEPGNYSLSTYVDVNSGDAKLEKVSRNTDYVAPMFQLKPTNNEMLPTSAFDSSMIMSNLTKQSMDETFPYSVNKLGSPRAPAIKSENTKSALFQALPAIPSNDASSPTITHSSSFPSLASKSALLPKLPYSASATPQHSSHNQPQTPPATLNSPHKHHIKQQRFGIFSSFKFSLPKKTAKQDPQYESK